MREDLAIKAPLGAMGTRMLRWRTRLSADGLGLAVMYHGIARGPHAPRPQLVPTPEITTFRAQLEHLAAHYRVVPPSRLLQAAGGRRRGDAPAIAITFDDDLASHRQLAMPILLELGLPAGFFVSGASLSGPFAFWWERLQRLMDERDHAPAALPSWLRMRVGAEGQGDSIQAIARVIENLSPSERDAAAAELGDLVGPDPPDAGLRREAVRELAQAGFEIGFHTKRHYKLSLLPDADLHRSLREGRNEIEATVGSRLSMIAYPHGAADARVARFAAAAGFRLGFTTTPHAVAPAGDPLLVGRIDAEAISVKRLASTLAAAAAYPSGG